MAEPSEQVADPDLLLINQLNLFERNPWTDQVKSENYLPIQSINVLDSQSGRSNGILTFRHFGDNHFINLSKSYFRFIVQITDKDGHNIDFKESKVAPVNLFACSLIKNLKFSLNNSIVTPMYQTFGLTQYLVHLLSYSSDVKANKLQMLLWHKDKSTAMDSLVVTNTLNKTLTSDNTGLMNRRDSFSSDGKVELILNLNFDLAKQNKYILPLLNFEIELQLQNSQFVLMHAADDTYDFCVRKAELYLCKVHLEQSTSLAIESVLSMYPAIYEFNENVTRLLTLSSGASHFSFDPLFVALNPTKAIIGLIESDAIAGKSTKNPYNFQPHDIQAISIFLGSKSYPFIEEPMSFEDKQFLIHYNRLHNTVGCGLENNQSFSISPSEYKAGFTLFGYEFHGSAVIQDNLQTRPVIGPLRLDFRFSKPLTKTLTAVLLLTFPSKVVVNKRREVFYNSPTQ